MQKLSRIAGLAVMCLVAASAVAEAKAADPFKTYLAAVTQGTATSYLDACETLVTPGGEVRRPCKLALADLVPAGTDPAKVTLEVTAARRADIDQSTLAYHETTVLARAGKQKLAVYRVIEVFTILGNPDLGPSPVAVHWVRTIADKDALARATAKTLAAPPAIAEHLDTPAQPDQERADAEDLARDMDTFRGDAAVRDTVARWLERGAVVYGSAPGQKLVGKKAARAVTGWKLDLAQDGALDRVAWSLGGITVGHVVATTRGASPVKLTYTVVIVHSQGLSGGGGLISDVRLVSFALSP